MDEATTFTPQVRGVRLSPFKPAAELSISEFDGGWIRLPLDCGKHEASYPVELALETLQTGRHYVFRAERSCPYGYIIRTEDDGAHMKRWGEPEAVKAAYEEWPGDELVVEDERGAFFFKEE